MGTHVKIIVPRVHYLRIHHGTCSHNRMVNKKKIAKIKLQPTSISTTMMIQSKTWGHIIGATILK